MSHNSTEYINLSHKSTEYIKTLEVETKPGQKVQNRLTT